MTCAIGEIALVVIGILIALQINTWNDHRVKKSEISNSYIDVMEELENDVILLDKYLPIFNWKSGVNAQNGKNSFFFLCCSTFSKTDLALMIIFDAPSILLVADPNIGIFKKNVFCIFCQHLHANCDWKFQSVTP